MRFLAPFLAYALGLLLSAIYWLPAALESKYVSLDAAATQYQIREEFLRLEDILAPIPAIDLTALNHPRSLSVGLVQLILFAIGTIIALTFRRLTRWQRAHVFFGAFFAIFSIYMMQYRSLWLWEALPGADLILYPHRLLGIVAVALLPAIAITIDQIPLRWRPFGTILALGLILFAALPQLYPYKTNFPDLGEVSPLTSLQYEQETGNYGGVATNEYTPRWAAIAPTTPPACFDCYREWTWRIYPEVIPPEAQLEISDGQHRTGTEFLVESETDWQLELHQMYYPGWRAELDSEPIDLEITDPHGLMAVNIPSGQHTLEVWYGGTTAQRIGTWISLLALVATLGIAAYSVGTGLRERSESDLSSPPQANSSDLRWLPLAAITIVILFSTFNASTDRFHHRSDLENPASMQHKSNIIFYDDAGTPMMELLGYNLSSTDATYGEWVYIDLYWRALRDLETDFRVNVTLLFPEIELGRTSSDNFAPGTFPTSTWPLDKYVVDTHILRMDAAVEPGEGDLVALVYHGDQQLRNAAGDTLIPFARLNVR